MLLSDLKRIQVDSATMAVDVKSLRLTVDEYKRFRAKDAGPLKREKTVATLTCSKMLCKCPLFAREKIKGISFST